MLTRSRRPAFTLVELLVVVSIIAVLVALTATAVFAVRSGAQKSNAEATLQKIDQKVEQRMKTMRESINADFRDRKDHPEVVAMTAAANGNPDVAKALMLYGRTRRDFPMTYAEAKSDFIVAGYTYRASPAFAGLPAPGAGDIEESAACLYAIVAPIGLDGLEQQVGKNAANQNAFIDGMGSPIAFVRLGYDGNAAELNSKAFDPFYPNKTGAGAYRNLASDFDAINGAGAFEMQVWDRPNGVRSTVGWVAVPTDYPGLKNHTWFVISAGPNRLFPEAPSNTIYDGDNLLSYRLRREGAGGD
jgi:prepilin-type N-terminal cleavage/methylation domain-containing protein